MNEVKERIGKTIKTFSGFVRVFVFSIIPFFLTLLSAFFIRYVPTVFGNLCGPNRDEFCYTPLPQAGFPFAYWIDQGGISAMGQLGFEDEISALAFGADFLFYFLIVLSIDFLIKRRRSQRHG